MEQLPIHDGRASCGLDEQGAARRNAEFAEVVEHGLRARQRIAGKVRLIFQRKNGLEEDIRELVRRESQCCGFFAFDMTVGKDDILVEVTAPRAVPGDRTASPNRKRSTFPDGTAQ